MNKKILSAALCISLIAFSSCSKIIKEIKVEEKTHTIGFAYSGKTEYAYVERYKSIKEEFSSHDSDTLIILDAKGNAVKSYIFENAAPVSVEWNGTDDNKSIVADGVYSYEIESTDLAGNKSERAVISNIIF